jgi:hypothetical protein
MAGETRKHLKERETGSGPHARRGGGRRASRVPAGRDSSGTGASRSVGGGSGEGQAAGLMPHGAQEEARLRRQAVAPRGAVRGAAPQARDVVLHLAGADDAWTAERLPVY